MIMEHFIRIAFCIVAVALTLSGCRPTGIQEYGITILRNEVKCTEPGSEFYTPDSTQDRCITNALECFRLELGTVQDECEDHFERIDQTVEMMNNTIDSLKEKDKTRLNSTGCKSCEEWDKKPFAEFLDKCTDFLQMAHVVLSN